MPPPDLEDLRSEIDALNLRLRDLLQQRARLVVAIARAKAAAGLPIADPEREAGMLASVLREPGAGFERPVLERLFRAVFAESRTLAERGAGGS